MPFDPEELVGKQVTVVANQAGHGFEIGTAIMLEEFSGKNRQGRYTFWARGWCGSYMDSFYVYLCDVRLPLGVKGA